MDIKMTPDVAFEAENETRALLLTVEDAYRDYEIRLALFSPAGRRFLSQPIGLTDGSAVYALPAAVLDAKGMLLAQLVAADANSHVAKSRIFAFRVERSILFREDSAENGALITLSGVFSQVQSLWETLEDYARKAEIPTKTGDLINDAGYLTQHQSLAAYATTAAVNTALGLKADKTELPTVDSALSGTSENPVQNKAVKAALDLKADKTELPVLDAAPVNGSENAVQSGGVYTAIQEAIQEGAGITVDTEMSGTSTNPVQNKAVKAALDLKADASALAGKADVSALSGKADVSALAGKSDVGHTHSAADITSGTLPVARGGTGVTTTAALQAAVLPESTGTLTHHSSVASKVSTETVEVRQVGNVVSLYAEVGFSSEVSFAAMGSISGVAFPRSGAVGGCTIYKSNQAYPAWVSVENNGDFSVMDYADPLDANYVGFTKYVFSLTWLA